MDLIDLTTIRNGFLEFAQVLLQGFSNALKLLFNDLPTIGGLSLGWWFVILGFLPFLISLIIG